MDDIVVEVIYYVRTGGKLIPRKDDNPHPNLNHNPDPHYNRV